jgi:hypothetical protein
MSDNVDCPACHGHGSIIKKLTTEKPDLDKKGKQQRNASGHLMTIITSEDVESKCDACGGEGEVDEERAAIIADGIKKRKKTAKEINDEYPDKVAKKKSSAASRTRDIMDAINEAQKRGSSDEIIEGLTDSIRVAKLDNESGKLPVDQGEDTMAAKKKSAKKNGSAKAVKTAEPIGRERKLLLRLSTDEYNTLKQKAEKAGTSMANFLRSNSGL